VIRPASVRRARTAIRVIALVLALACAAAAVIRAGWAGEGGERIAGMLEIGPALHERGTNLPPWAACMFPHRANPGAVRRARPCPAESGTHAVQDPGRIAGCCWKIESMETGRLRGMLAFPLRLRTDSAAGSGDGRRRAHGIDIPDSMRMHEAHFETMWWFSPPDSVTIASGNGFTGTVLSFRARGDTMPGMARGFSDVIEMTADTTTDRVLRVQAVRIPC
jgi:hypothetical protein